MDTKTVLASGALAAIVSITAPALVSYVTLQAASPGSAEIGNTNVAGNSMASRFGAGIKPTLARVQVNEAGAVQGVRSVTASGIAVFGQNNAASGAGNGGYFTSKSTSGKALIADETSTTGTTFGGSFISRSTAGGGAVQARQIAATGSSYGVDAEVNSPNASAVFAKNNSTGAAVQLGGPNGAIYANGGMINRNYGSGPMGAVPIAYGVVNSNGTIGGGTGNFSINKTGTGQYAVTVTGENMSYFTYPAVAIPAGSGSVGDTSVNTTLVFNVYNIAGNPSDNFFSFAIFKAVSGAFYPPTPKHGFKDDLEWMKKRPMEAKKYFAACREAERFALATDVTGTAP